MWGNQSHDKYGSGTNSQNSGSSSGSGNQYTQGSKYGTSGANMGSQSTTQGSQYTAGSSASQDWQGANPQQQFSQQQHLQSQQPQSSSTARDGQQSPNLYGSSSSTSSGYTSPTYGSSSGSLNSNSNSSDTYGSSSSSSKSGSVFSGKDSSAKDFTSGTDVVAFLKGQHSEIKNLFEKVMKAKGKERQALFYDLRRLLAVHETAEEQIVHPAARSALANGEAVVDTRLQEENKAKSTLVKLEDLPADTKEFERYFAQLKADVTAHAEAEEREEFEKLAAVFDPAKLERMRKAVEAAEAIAPTRPHPGVESATANTVVGPFASMVDRIRDAFAGKGSGSSS